MDIRPYVVVTYSSVYNQVFLNCVTVEGIRTKRGCLKVRNDKPPARTTVVLILTIGSCRQTMAFVQVVTCHQIGRVSIFLELTLQ